MSNNGYLGIDISKGYADFLVLKANKEVVEIAFRLYDVVEGHQQLGKIIDASVQGSVILRSSTTSHASTFQQSLTVLYTDALRA